MRIKTSDNVSLDFSTFGNKTNQALVLIHGLGADRYMWAPQIDNYPKEDLFLIVPDMRGHGKSARINNFRIYDCARDVSEILDYLNIKNANIAGVSMGGTIAQQFACDFPHITEKLIIVDSFSEVSSWQEKLRGWLQWLTIKFTPGLMSKSLKSVYPEDEYAEILQYFRESFARIDKDQLLMARAALNKFDITYRLKEINSPARVLVGDGFGDFAIKMARKTADAILNADFQILKGGFDPSNLIVTEAFDKNVLEFLKDK